MRRRDTEDRAPPGRALLERPELMFLPGGGELGREKLCELLGREKLRLLFEYDELGRESPALLGLWNTRVADGLRNAELPRGRGATRALDGLR